MLEQGWTGPSRIGGQPPFRVLKLRRPCPLLLCNVVRSVLETSYIQGAAPCHFVVARAEGLSPMPVLKLPTQQVSGLMDAQYSAMGPGSD